MSAMDFIRDSTTFDTLWERANAGIQSLLHTPSTELLYFDSIDPIEDRARYVAATKKARPTRAFPID